MQNMQNMIYTKPNTPGKTYHANPTKPNLPNQNYQTKPYEPKLPNQTLQTIPTKPNLPNQNVAYWTKATKPKLLVKVVNAWVRSAFGNVFNKNPLSSEAKTWENLRLYSKRKIAYCV